MLPAQTGWSSKRWLMISPWTAHRFPLLAQTLLPQMLRAKVAVHPVAIAVVVVAAMTVAALAAIVVAVVAAMIAVVVAAVTMTAAKS